MTVDSASDFYTPEREQKIDLLAHLLANGNKPLLIRAPRGGGKTHFLHRLSGRLRVSHACLVVEDAAHITSLEELIQRICAKLSLAANQLRIRLVDLAERNQDLVVIIDDVQLMPELVLQALMELATQHDSLKLILAASENLEMIEQFCQLIDLEPYSQKQTIQFAEHLLSELESKASVKDMDELVLFIETGGLPGRIKDAVSSQLLGQKIVPTFSTKQAKTSPLVWPLTAGVLIATAVISFWYMSSGEQAAPDRVVVQAEVSDSPPSDDRAIERTVTKAIPEKVIPLAEDQPLLENKPDPVESSVVVSDDSASRAAAIPEAMAIEPAVQPESEDLTPVEAQTAKAEVMPQPVVEPQPVEAISPTAAAPAQRPEPNPTVKPIAQIPSQLASDREWINSKQSGEYTFQVMAVSTFESAQKFVNGHAQKENLHIYQSKRHNGAWYGILYAAYANKAAANRSVEQVRAMFAGIDPWARSFESIQKDLY